MKIYKHIIRIILSRLRLTGCVKNIIVNCIYNNVHLTDFDNSIVLSRPGLRLTRHFVSWTVASDDGPGLLRVIDKGEKMTVDNSGIILIGHKGKPETCLVFYPEEQRSEGKEYGEYIDDFFDANKSGFASSLSLDWSLGKPFGHNSFGLAGFHIRSPSYGVKVLKLSRFASDVVKISQEWERQFGKPPEVFVLNSQW